MFLKKEDSDVASCLGIYAHAHTGIKISSESYLKHFLYPIALVIHVLAMKAKEERVSGYSPPAQKAKSPQIEFGKQ